MLVPNPCNGGPRVLKTLVFLALVTIFELRFLESLSETVKGRVALIRRMNVLDTALDDNPPRNNDIVQNVD